jgi:aminopeptidase N
MCGHPPLPPLAAAGKRVTLEEVLLPTHATPVSYDIDLAVDLVACTFRGTVAVRLDVNTARPTLTLHAKQLAIDPACVSFLTAGGVKLPAVGMEADLELDKVTFRFAEDVPVGRGTLTIAGFRGDLNDELVGLYRAKTTLRGVDRWTACTQFEATDARRAFPCWDEPSWKATFAVKLTGPAEDVILSNMTPIRSVASPDGKTRTITFAETPRQSTYLVAFIVGPFDSVSAVDDTGVLTTVYTPVGKAALGDFALKVSLGALPYMARLFKIPYFGGVKASGATGRGGAGEGLWWIARRAATIGSGQRATPVTASDRARRVVRRWTTSRCPPSAWAPWRTRVSPLVPTAAADAHSTPSPSPSSQGASRTARRRCCATRPRPA